MRPDIPRELADIYLGLVVCLVALVVLVIFIRRLYRRTFSYRVRPAILLMRQGQYSEAAGKLSDLAIRFPNDIAIQVLLLLCFRQIEAYSDALDSAKQAAEMLKKPEVAKSNYIMTFIRQMSHLSNLTYQQAVENWLEQMCTSLNILKAYHEENYQQALLLVEKTIGSTVDGHSKYLSWKAHFILLLKDIARSGTILSEAERIIPVDPQVAIIRGHWYLVQGEVRAAIARYLEHDNRKSIEEDLRHIAKVFGITPPTW